MASMILQLRFFSPALQKRALWCPAVMEKSKSAKIRRMSSPASMVPLMQRPLRNQGLEAAQAGLDLMSIMGTVDLLTQKSTEEYLLSWRTGMKQIVRIYSTTTMSFTVNSPTISVKDKDGNDVTKTPSIPDHHYAYRYFRLSQTSDDLYDAFRNMYLSFEMLLSSKHPPFPRERERTWLESGIARVANDLDLGKFFKPKPMSLVDEIISRVYTSARLPLFHAKNDRKALPPHGSMEERQNY